ncbi:uncharacterized protein LOC132271220 isoform X2 [Cornus florida]|uniref:uncharacterized protein LOC132271220 isoform X2 n=1 Tax=Cornus florida TaxID=4283 RepID=UPI0028991199|nr:uncharacterized protein LOC132271220 isoform X2 [Cornus florida]
MVVKMMKWRPWPPLSSKKFETKISIRRLEGLRVSSEAVAEKRVVFEEFSRLSVEIKWKGSKGKALRSLRRSVKRNFTKEEGFQDHGVEWNEEFSSVCSFSEYKEGVFHPWEVAFTVFNGSNQGPKNKLPVVASASLNLSDFASTAEGKELEISIPLTVLGASVECSPSLFISLSLLELRTAQEPLEIVQRSVASVPVSPSSGEALSSERDERSALKAGLRKVKLFTGYVSAQRAKKACREEEGSDGKSSVRSEDAEYNYPFDTDSPDDLDEEESEEGKKDSNVQESFSYGTLAHAKNAELFCSNASNSEDEGLIYYSNRESDKVQTLQQTSKRSILPWRKRKLNFRSPKKNKGEPLLKRHYGEEGGDDIDYDRRQLSSSDESSFGHKSEEDSTTNRSSVSEFGDDKFAIGSWENKEVVSRDGHMKLQTEVFFASIDQRSEQAAGESACTALVAVIADWFQVNHDEMPIKSELDSLIREGSFEWRNLCENEAYKERFPDKHFDLETVLQAKVRPLSVLPDKSFIGFFHPEGLEKEGSFHFLHGAMSFDSIWDEISRFGSENSGKDKPLVYIVSWNDHFFILKIEQDAYYIIDTLGERLYEGCNQAYVLRFDKDTTIHRLPEETQPSAEKSAGEKEQEDKCKDTETEGTQIVISNELENSGEELVVCSGKESCKEYIKSFLAAIPIRELQVDLKKGLLSSTPLHHRLQIEFHYTQCLQPVAQFSSLELTADVPALAVSA